MKSGEIPDPAGVVGEGGCSDGEAGGRAARPVARAPAFAGGAAESGATLPVLVGADGVVIALYDEALDLSPLGRSAIGRAGHVEPDARGGWTADLGPSGGPVLGPFGGRGAAMAAERAWLIAHRFGGG